MNDLITVDEAARSIGIWPTALRGHIERRNIPARRFGRRVLMLLKSDVEKFIAARKAGLYGGDSQQLDQLVADGAAFELVRYAQCALCGHVDGGDGDPILVKGGKVMCRRCWQYARQWIPET